MLRKLEAGVLALAVRLRTPRGDNSVGKGVWIAVVVVIGAIVIGDVNAVLPGGLRGILNNLITAVNNQIANF